MSVQFVIERAEVLSSKLKCAYLYFRGLHHFKTKYPHELMQTGAKLEFALRSLNPITPRLLDETAIIQPARQAIPRSTFTLSPARKPRA